MVVSRAWPRATVIAVFIGILLTTTAPVQAQIGLTRQPDPLGYPKSIGDEADAKASEAVGSIWPPQKRADEPQVPGGLDAQRGVGYSEFPGDLLTFGEEPMPASCCDRNLIDPAWMGPGELAYHIAPNARPCTRDHTRVFRNWLLGRTWLSAEYLLWATSGQSVPPLITASPLGTPASDIGVIGTPGTEILFGGGGVDGIMRSGARLASGYWFTPRQERGIEASWFGLANASETALFVSDGGNPWLARPFINASSGLPAAMVVPPPGGIPADPADILQASASSITTQFGSVDVIYLHNLLGKENFHRRYLVGGYRYLMLDDRLSVETESLVRTGGGYPVMGYATTDAFRTFNQFNGGEIGLVERWWRDRWSLKLLGKLALGATTVGTAIGGSTTTTETDITPTGIETTTTGSYPGGVLAQTTNPGNTRAFFAGVGEFGATADYAIFSQFRVTVGYSLIYWTTVGRVGDQVDPTVNPTQFGGGTLDGPAAPSFDLWTTGFWAQGVNVGFEYQF
jgi:hypothetical protein